MARRLKNFLSLSAAFLGYFALSDDLNTGGNWPGQPYWFPNTPGTPPAPASLNNSTPAFTFGAHQPPQTQNGHTNWPQPYAYQPFSQPPLFGFTQVPQLMYYSSFPPQSGPELVQVDAPDTDSEMLPARSMRQPSSAITGFPSPCHDVRRRMMEDIDEEPVSSHHDQKGKGKASHQQLDWDRKVDNYHHRSDEYRENEREVERARRRAEQTPIPQHILDMQARDFADASNMHNDHTTNLEKMLTKRQLSPGGYLGHHSKCQRESHGHQHQHKAQCRIDAELDEFLEMDDNYPLPRRQWNRECGQGGYTGSRGREFSQPSRGRDPVPGRLQKQPADATTMLPRQTQRLLNKDKHDERLDSYDQRRFGNVIWDERMSLEEWLADLLADLPAMPLANGSYPCLTPANRSFTDLMDGVGSSSDDTPDMNKKLPNSVQRPATMDERDNSFRGMYGPRFTYNPQMNVMYADREAVDAT
ncbi:hypothetical protein ARMGADRAFT_1077683 [Armillaria gallica]|uniref:Uncharacterized protein n=1 Tax=Armillaria gallica TaxID=47427 RepID=A0A2H3E6I1_ARMGA|nr:hypothetical protein ARMGADRAFT_1077683 [Armillaria gallica]